MNEPRPGSLVLYQADTTRQCGHCNLCCKLLPTPELKKPANTRCQHQRFGRCTIYANRPSGCRYWSCRWLLGNDTGDLRRPDRSHYVIDPTPDFIRMVGPDGALVANVEVVQIWVDPHHRDAHRDPLLRRYLLRRAEEGIAALIRYGSKEGFTLFPPSMTVEREWREQWGMQEAEHSLADFMDASAENDGIIARKAGE